MFKGSSDTAAIQYRCSWFINDVCTRQYWSQATTQLQMSWWGNPPSFLKSNQLTMGRESTYLPPVSDGSRGIDLLSTRSLQSESIILHLLQVNMSIFDSQMMMYTQLWVSDRWVTLEIIDLWWQCGDVEVDIREWWNESSVEGRKYERQSCKGFHAWGEWRGEWIKKWWGEGSTFSLMTLLIHG